MDRSLVLAWLLVALAGCEARRAAPTPAPVPAVRSLIPVAPLRPVVLPSPKDKPPTFVPGSAPPPPEPSEPRPEEPLATSPEECAWEGMIVRVRDRVRERRFGAAASILRGWTGPEPSTGSVQRRIELVEWLADTFRRLERQGLVVPDRPTREHARGLGHLRSAPRADAPEPPTVGGEIQAPRDVDVWARLAGWSLVAVPEGAPVLSTTDPWALVGWIRDAELGGSPLARQYQDVGRPLRIARPNRFGGVRLWDGPARPCDACGRPGVFREDPSHDARCVPLQELCGGPGIADGRINVDDVDYAYFPTGGCAHCAPPSRTLPAVGSYCRAPEPGWTWQCGPGNATLVCEGPRRE